MEERQLNFNQPLLSVRRGSSMAAQLEINRKKAHDSDITVPPLPYYKSELNSGPVRNPGVVPFQWEQMPGRPKHENKVPKDSIWQLSVDPKLPPGRIPRALDIPFMAKGLVQFEGSAKDAKDKNVSNCDDDNVTFVDAHDSLSRTESYSGIFLPAANAVTSETPHFVSREHSGIREELKPVTRLIKWKQKVSQSQGRFPCKVNGKEEEYVRMDDLSDKFCGLLPKFCVLNPVPGMRDHAREVSVVRSVHTRPEHAESCKKTENQYKTVSHRGNMKRVAHQHASKTEPLMDKDFCGRIITPLQDGLHHLFLDKEKRIQDAQQTTILANLDTEKTLYVDSEPREHHRNSFSGSSESRGRNPCVDLLPDIKSITFSHERQIFPSKSSDTIDSKVVSTREKTFQDDAEDLQKHQDFNVNIVQELSLGLLLPKSPSESWLSRTLPSMPTKKPSSKLYFGNLAYR